MENKAELCAMATGGIGMFILAEGLIAGFGAASGAIGWGIVHNAAGWTVPKFGYTTFVQACTAGNMVIGNIGLCLSSSTSKSEDTKQKAIVTLLWAGLTGACSGMLGTQMLGVLSSGSEVGFAAAAGATGAAISALSLGGIIMAVTCVGGIAYLCCNDEFGDVKLIKVPKENFDARGNIKSLDNATIHTAEEVFKDQKYHTMQGISQAMEQQLNIKIEIPEAYSTDSENKQDNARGCLSRAMTRLGF